MKAFRGTLAAAVVLALVAVFFLVVKPELGTPEPVGHPKLFQFEKHELVRVQVDRTDGDSIILEEVDGHWVIEGTGFVAGRSMVNRVKHQIHDLTARATVIEASDGAELYGLGDNALTVSLELRDGRTLSFKAGDPNPSSVSYYVQPLPGDTIYTVQKAAVDYYSLTLDEFRERRFASFDSKDATAIVAHVATAEATHTLEIEKVGERQWDMSQPVEMAANDDRVRRLLGRVSALKAKDFESMESESDLARFGLDAPRLDVTVRFASRDPLQLKVGADSPSDNRYEELAYVRIEGDETVYVARRGLLEEFGQDPSELRNRRVVRMKATDVIAVDAELRADPDDDLEGEAGVRYAADEWFWKDGVPVPGSTPERVARALAELEVDAFIDDEPKSLGEYGLDDPRARAVLSDGEGNERVVLIGNEGEPWVDPEGHERPRLFVAIEGAAPVYLVDERALSVVKDMIREGNRKKKKDAEKAARRERIPSDAIPDDPEEGDGTEG